MQILPRELIDNIIKYLDFKDILKMRFLKSVFSKSKISLDFNKLDYLSNIKFTEQVCIIGLYQIIKKINILKIIIEDDIFLNVFKNKHYKIIYYFVKKTNLKKLIKYKINTKSFYDYITDSDELFYYLWNENVLECNFRLIDSLFNTREKTLIELESFKKIYFLMMESINNENKMCKNISNFCYLRFSENTNFMNLLPREALFFYFLVNSLKMNHPMSIFLFTINEDLFNKLWSLIPH